MSAHTPGPWMPLTNDTTDMSFVGPNGENIIGGCGCCGSPFGVENLDESEANRKLIAAAPDLLDALRNAVLVMESIDTVRHLAPTFPALDNARAALAKAAP